jgi:O-antigen/teichoic acid export membrane protein
MTKKDRRSHFARNVVANWIAFLFAAVVGFFMSPYVVEHLGATRYGVWSLLAGMIGYLALLDLGIRQAVNRYVAHHRAVGAHDESSSIVSAALRLFGILGLLAISLAAAFAYLAPVFFNIPEALVNDTRIIVVLGGLTVAVTLIGGVFGGLLTGLERFDVNCLLEISMTAGRAAAMVIALREGYGLVSLACILLAASVLQCVAYWAVDRRLYSELRLRFRGRLVPQMKTLLSFGSSLSAIFVLKALVLNSDAMIIAAFLPIEAVTFFAIAGILCYQANGVTASMSYVMTPRVSRLMSAGGNRVGEEILAVARIATLIAAPVAATFLLRGESFITLWMGPAYGPESGEVLRVLAFVLWLEATRSVVIQSLTGMARQRMLIPGVAIEAVCKLALSVALVGPLGIVGVALGTLIPSMLVNLGFIPFCLSKATTVSTRLFHRNAVLLPTAACVPFALASAAIEQHVPATNLAIFFAQVVLILPLIPVAAWFLCLTPAEKEAARARIAKMLARK